MSTLCDRETAVSIAAPRSAALDDLLHKLVEHQASDLHLKPMRPPLLRIHGQLAPIGSVPLSPEDVRQMLDPIVPERLRKRLGEQMSVDFGYGIGGLSRFRASIFHQRGTMAGVFRRVPYDFPTLSEWGMPSILEEFCEPSQGLVLITGPTGSGKSSTLAAMMMYIAERRRCHIVTIEDPIEFLITDNLASVSQREIGIDTPDFESALRGILRQDPDVIMVGEARDTVTLRTVLTAAETGHLVFTTLHTNSAVQTVDRIVTSFPDNNHRQIRQQLAATLEAVVSLQLVPRADGQGMVAAAEILRRTPQVSKLILQGDFESLQEAIEKSVVYHKMQSMNQSLAALMLHGTITKETAMSASGNPADLDLMLRKIVGMRSAGEDEDGQGEAMAEPTNDFSKIVELLELKRIHEELQERHTQEIANRDHEIAELRDEVARLGDRTETDARIAELETENERLAQSVKTIREDCEGKIERLQNRVRELSSEASRDTANSGRKGFFRR